MSAGEERPDVSERLAKLGPAQRALLEKQLLEKRSTAAAAARIPRRTVVSPVPLSYSQELLWLLSQLESAGWPTTRRPRSGCRGRSTRTRCNVRSNALVARHEILRTTYDVIDGRPMQIVAPAGTVELRRVDLSALARSERDAEAAPDPARGLGARVRPAARERAAPLADQARRRRPRLLLRHPPHRDRRLLARGAP